MNKYKAIALIKTFFLEGVSAANAMVEIKALTPEDKQQLASAIARQMGYTQDQCDFEFVAY